jgi:hypothetical protein
VLYFGSLFPQLNLNCRRKFVEEVSMLFTLLACLESLMYVFFIIVFDPSSTVSNRYKSYDAGKIYGRLVLVNLLWLVTLLLVLAIFVQTEIAIIIILLQGVATSRGNASYLGQGYSIDY